MGGAHRTSSCAAYMSSSLTGFSTYSMQNSARGHQARLGANASGDGPSESELPAKASERREQKVSHPQIIGSRLRTESAFDGAPRPHSERR